MSPLSDALAAYKMQLEQEVTFEKTPLDEILQRYLEVGKTAQLAKSFSEDPRMGSEISKAISDIDGYLVRIAGGIVGDVFTKETAIADIKTQLASKATKIGKNLLNALGQTTDSYMNSMFGIDLLEPVHPEEFSDVSQMTDNTYIYTKVFGDTAEEKSLIDRLTGKGILIDTDMFKMFEAYPIKVDDTALDTYNDAVKAFNELKPDVSEEDRLAAQTAVARAMKAAKDAHAQLNADLFYDLLKMKKYLESISSLQVIVDRATTSTKQAERKFDYVVQDKVVVAREALLSIHENLDEIKEYAGIVERQSMGPIQRIITFLWSSLINFICSVLVSFFPVLKPVLFPPKEKHEIAQFGNQGWRKSSPGYGGVSNLAEDEERVTITVSGLKPPTAKQWLERATNN